MARPPRQRQVVSHIREGLFLPCAGGREAPDDAVELTLDGLEALRLVDVEGLYQEAAAEAMGVSRATLARVLARARRAVAEALVRQQALVIGGGGHPARSGEGPTVSRTRRSPPTRPWLPLWRWPRPRAGSRPRMGRHGT